MTPSPLTLQRPAHGTQQIRYADSAETISVTVMFSYTREEVSVPIMSASNGPKDYLKNQAYALFASNPTLDLILLLRGRGPLFFLARGSDGVWFDTAGRQVVRA